MKSKSEILFFRAYYSSNYPVFVFFIQLSQKILSSTT